MPGAWRPVNTGSRQGWYSLLPRVGPSGLRRLANVQAHNQDRRARRGVDSARTAHNLVSILSSQGVPIEEIARVAGHSGGSQVTETVYRQELRPVIQTMAQVMDKIFKRRRIVRRRPA